MVLANLVEIMRLLAVKLGAYRAEHLRVGAQLAIAADEIAPE
jgi:hypothetical protein